MSKFRTMRKGTPDIATHLMTNHRIHVKLIGHVLRKSIMDELPQLSNVLKGNMSFVGLRPARLVASMGHRLLGFPLTPSRVDALTGRARISIERIRHELGFAPRIAATESLSSFIHAMRKGAMRTHD